MGIVGLDFRAAGRTQATVEQQTTALRSQLQLAAAWGLAVILTCRRDETAEEPHAEQVLCEVLEATVGTEAPPLILHGGDGSGFEQLLSRFPNLLVSFSGTLTQSAQQGHMTCSQWCVTSMPQPRDGARMLAWSLSHLDEEL